MKPHFLNLEIKKSKIDSRAEDFHSKYYSEVSDNDWNNWQWQLKNRITSLEQLEKFLILSPAEYEAIKNNNKHLPLNITPYYASLLDPADAAQAIRRAVVPVVDENIVSEGEKADPLNEDGCSPVPGIVHRYPDRVLFLVTDFCSVYCRYCTRSRMVSHCETTNSVRQWEQAIAYIEDHKEIRDVLISGGDPLTMPDEMIEWLLSKLRKIEHVEFIRIGTKAPVVLPQRITPALTKMLKKYHPLWMSIHFTHPDELTPETIRACGMLADAGIPLGSQTVLLKGINDEVDTLKSLFHKLLQARVRPYYLYQCDPIQGSAHFRTSVKKGLDMIYGLRGQTTGYAVPTYVIDAPGGGGKIPLFPENYCREGNNIKLINRDGLTFYYPDVNED